MFFKRNQPGDEAAAAAARLDTPPVDPLSPDDVRRRVDPDSLGFRSTAELEVASGLIGQERALKAIKFGASIKQQDFNIFVLGAASSGKRTAVKTYLQRRLSDAPTPPDQAYVNNFELPNRPIAIALPPGRAQRLSDGMVRAIDELRTSIPTMFEGEEYETRRRVMDEEFRSFQENAMEELNEKAKTQQIAVLRTPNGFAMAPTADGKVVKPEEFNEFDEDVRKDIESKVEALQKELAEILERVPKMDKERRAKVRDLNEEFAAIAVSEALDELVEEFTDLPEPTQYLKAAHGDLIRNVGLFVDPGGEHGEDNQIVKQTTETAHDPRYRRYMINVMVTAADRDGEGAPLIEELNPVYGQLIGRVEHIAQMGTLVTDFLLMKAGALHKANGGYLLLDARKLLLSPFAWEALKRAMKAGEIRLEPPAETAGLMTTQSLDPEPIPLDVKIVLLGDRQLYYMLAANDPDFTRLFKVQADFDDTIGRSDANERAYAQLIASIVRQHELHHIDADGTARLIEEGARLANDREKLSIEIGKIADIIREADFWASEVDRDLITRADVTRAIEERTQRTDRMRDRAQETIERGIVLLDTDGEEVGQINGLSVLSLGDFAFGRPTRITARVRLGSGRVTDIEREVELGGPLHSKGVMILWGFLAGRYAQDIPLMLAASLVFEQSYGGVDGDSASSAELYALLSALSNVPISQSFAVTGAVNQHGEVQAIGGANEKIEGFFDICKARGLTGRQGVLIPASNVQHLMLREDVVEAIRAKQFAIYPISTIDQGIEVLTGFRAGARDEHGHFPAGTINRRVEDTLHEFAERGRAFAQVGSSGGNGAKLMS